MESPEANLGDRQRNLHRVLSNAGVGSLFRLAQPHISAKSSNPLTKHGNFNSTVNVIAK